MTAYTITMTEKEIRRFKHQLSNAVGLLGGNDGTVNTLRDLRDLLEKTIIDSNNTDDFFAIGIGNYLYWAGPDEATFSDNLNAIKRFPDAESAMKAIMDNDIKGAPVHVVIPKSKRTINH